MSLYFLPRDAYMLSPGVRLCVCHVRELRQNE